MVFLFMSVFEQISRFWDDTKKSLNYSEMDKHIWMAFKTGNGEVLGPIEICLFAEELPILTKTFAAYCVSHPPDSQDSSGGSMSTPTPHFIGHRVLPISSPRAFIMSSGSAIDNDGVQIDLMPLQEKLKTLDESGKIGQKTKIHHKLDLNRAGTVCLMRKVTDFNKVCPKFCIFIDPVNDDELKVDLPGEHNEFIVVGRVDENGLRTLKEMIRRYGTSSGVTTTPIIISDCGNY